MRWRKVFFALLLILSTSFLFSNVEASAEILSIDVDVTLLDNGDAQIVQKWKTDVDEGTEFFIPMTSLNHMGIENFQVSDEKGPYTFVENWDPNASFDEKANKCGINYISDGLELCFGKSEYGPKEYTLSWTYTNFVQHFSDLDGFLVRLVNDHMEPAPQKVRVTISLPGTELSVENAKIWGFGMEGNIDFKDGVVVAESQYFGYSSHATILMGLDEGLIHPTYEGTGTFEDLKDRAFVGSDYNNGNSDNSSSGFMDNASKSFSTLFNRILPLLFQFAIFFIGFTGLRSYQRQKKKYMPVNLAEVDYSRKQYSTEIPFDGDLVPNFYLYNQIDRKTKVNNLVAASLLYWHHLGALSFEPYIEHGFFREKDAYGFRFIKTPDFRNNFEKKLWEYLYHASGDNELLEEKELKHYVSRHPESYQSILDQAIPIGFHQSIQEGLLTPSTKKKNRQELTPAGFEALENLYGFQRYLEDYTIINERGADEVALWDNYLIIATLLGIGEEVLKEFKNLYPQYVFNEDMNRNNTAFDLYQMHYLTSHLANTASHSMDSALASRDSGGGGGFSSGGGGGFSGGGSGGGSR